MTYLPSIIIATLLSSALCISSCNNNESNIEIPNVAVDSIQKVEIVDTPIVQQPEYTYKLLSMRGNDSLYKELKALPHEQKIVLEHLNRIDFSRIRNLDSIIIPNENTGELMDYSPYPHKLPYIAAVNKIIYFSYLKQAYAVYEKGNLIKWGATSMGKKSTKTPTGLFFSNWKGRKITSTVNSSWILEYNFNVSNLGGVGWHKYDMPGYPASHSCMRLFMDDAKWLYDFAEQWILKNDEIQAKGTPVIIYGAYPWGERRPWRAITDNPQAIDISVEELTEVTQPHLDKILAEQQRRATLLLSENKSDTSQVTP